MKPIAEKMMANQMKISLGTSLFFGSLCFEADEHGELTRREDKEYDPNLITLGASSAGSIFEIGHDYDYNLPLGSRLTLEENGGVDLIYCTIPDSTRIRSEIDSDSSIDQYREVYMIRSGVNPSTKIPEGAEEFVTAVTADAVEFAKAATTRMDQPEDQGGEPYTTNTSSN